MKNRITQILLIAIIILLCGCTKLHTIPLKNNIKSMCIINNHSVIIPDFKDTLKTSIESHGILVTDTNYYNSINKCDATMVYTARRSWDMILFMSLVKIDIYVTSNHHEIGSLHYKVMNGLNLNKWWSHVSILPTLIDNLFTTT